MAAKEGRLQSECVHWYRNIWYQNPKALWATFNEGANVGGKISLGLQPGVPDLLLYERGGRGLMGIEMKAPGESHGVAHGLRQCQFILDVCDTGGFCDSLEDFKKIIAGTSSGFAPSKVIDYLYTVKAKSFTWDSSKFI